MHHALPLAFYFSLTFLYLFIAPASLGFGAKSLFVYRFSGVADKFLYAKNAALFFGEL